MKLIIGNTQVPLKIKMSNIGHSIKYHQINKSSYKNKLQIINSILNNNKMVNKILKKNLDKKERIK